MPTEPIYKTGKSGRLLIGGTNNFFAEWNMTIEKTWANATDSSGYDPTTKQLWKKQAAGGIGGSGSIIGFHDFAAGNSPTLAVLLADEPVGVIFGYDEDSNLGSGYITVKNYKTGVQVEGGETIGFTCDFDTYGVWSFE
jgi:hypothetical protein